jgi:hypothetical protein
MIQMLRNGLLCGALLLPLVAHGQRQSGAAVGILPTEYNSGFAGETGSPRLNTVVGMEAYENSTDHYGTYASYDQFIPSIRSGVGLTVGYNQFTFGNRQGGGYFSTGNNVLFALAVAPKLSMGGKVTLSPSVDFSFRPSRGEWNQYQVGNQTRGYAVGSRVGLLLNTEKFYAGYSVHLVDHFNTRAKNDTIDFRTRGRGERFESYWQFGYTFGRGTESKFSFTPQLVFRTGTDRYAFRGFRLFDPIDFNLNFRYKKFICGVNGSNQRSVHVGWQTDRLRIMLSDNLAYTRRYDQGYAANLALRYIFKTESTR